MSQDNVTITPEHLSVLRILDGQTPGYDAFPNATCFVVEGHHNFHRVAEILEDLSDAGLAFRYVYDVVVKGGHELLADLPLRKRLKHLMAGTHPDPVTEPVPGGFEISDAGRSLLKETS